MKNNNIKSGGAEKTKEKKSAGQVASKVLTVICAIAAVVLVVVTAFALINSQKDKAPSTGVSVPEVITTTEPTTLASADTVKIKGTVYAKKAVKLFAEPSSDAAVFATLDVAGSVGFVTVNKSTGWCTVTYNDKVCYAQAKYFDTKKPAAETTTTTEAVTTTEATTEETTTQATTAASSEGTTRKTVNPEQKHWSLVIVDKNRQLPEDFSPLLDYVSNSDHRLDARISVYYDAMYAAALKDGIELTPYSGYRSIETQENNYNYLVDQYLYQGYSQQEAEELAATEILPAGCSEHNMGFAMDICSTEESFRDTEAYAWLCENAHRYGFIERYPMDKQDVTGVIPEPWHWRFVGPAHADEMKRKGITTLEEYLESFGLKY